MPNVVDEEVEEAIDGVLGGLGELESDDGDGVVDGRSEGDAIERDTDRRDRAISREVSSELGTKQMDRPEERCEDGYEGGGEQLVVETKVNYVGIKVDSDPLDKREQETAMRVEREA